MGIGVKAVYLGTEISKPPAVLNFGGVEQRNGISFHQLKLTSIDVREYMQWFLL